MEPWFRISVADVQPVTQMVQGRAALVRVKKGRVVEALSVPPIVQWADDDSGVSDTAESGSSDCVLCVACGGHATRSRPCPGCRKVFYCSRACRRLGARKHSCT